MGDFSVFDSLENLQTRVRVRAQKRCEKEKTASQCTKLKEKYNDLVKRKSELQEKLQNDLPVSTDEEVVEMVSNIWKSRLERLLNWYQLTGISVTRRDENCVLVRFDTSFQGQYMEAYFMQLMYQKVTGIGKHSLPAFIPLEKFVTEVLAEDPEEFLLLISDHLQGYVQRREHLNMAEALLKERGYIKGEISGSLAMDIIQIHIARNTLTKSPVEILLRFDNLTYLVPSAAQISVLDETELTITEKKEWKKLLLSGPVSSTLDVLCPERPVNEETTSSDSESDTATLSPVT